MSEDKIPFLKVEAEGNPALGLRGIRLALKNENLFRTQVRAIIRASARQNIHILLPLISCVSELQRARQIIQEETDLIANQEQRTVRAIPVGVMIEVPAAVMMVEQLAAEADFLSVGTNDLIQYLLAVDRNNKQVSYLYQPLHPAVLQAIDRVIRVAQQQQKPLSVCGEMAADPMYAAILVGMGIRRLSMTPTAIPLVKEAVKAIDTQIVYQLVQEALTQNTAMAIEKFLCEKLTAHFPIFYASLRWHTHRWGKEKVN
jgi:phosphoenolpyruvate-protein kinase (PTS system EI component)